MNPFLRRLINAQSPFMKWLLSSPFHGLVSRWYMLITVTGRKSGKQYCIPVQYAPEQDDLYVIANETYMWWRNLQESTNVTVHLRGIDREGTAEASTTQADIQHAFRYIYPQINDEKIDSFANGKVAIHIRLAPIRSPVTV
jgi:deazaflavin-dependent oxidoreductase (nitroreductase family)